MSGGGIDGATVDGARGIGETASQNRGVAAWRLRLRAWLAHRTVQTVIIALIVVNAVTLGLETSPSVMAEVGPTLLAIDRAILMVFVAEIALRIIAWGWRFFRDPWSVFDLVVVGIALLPTTGSLSVLRALRILRVLRLISVIPRMRRVVAGLLRAIPGMGAIVALLALIFYVGAVIATKLFGTSFEEMFGSIGASLYTLFQVMTLEGWSGEVVRPVMEVYPYAWLFFIPFILATAFTMLNLFIGVIVDAMQDKGEGEQIPADAERALLLAEIRALRRSVDLLRDERGRGAVPPEGERARD